ncbi:alpha/beta fold hydrolase [Nakamurella sp. YIM 132087]|uniref:Alpha/beta fold hydrolase n=1 Tax=Nakamurella alba TaxID=2665158 RepID=A0A7K1FSJ3_9ACTN|nr:alpha/beta hydrolase [Nakamurella alba]MTD17116.1 alpha/beta fold hydrolase [Nakamurella alba]
MTTSGLRHGRTLVGDVVLHHVSAGEGPPLLLLHGFPQTWYEWRHVIDDLAADHLVIAPDHRGAGLSGRPHGGYDKVTMARDIRLLMDVLAPGQRPVVVGHDMGSFLAFAYATEFPDDIAGLCLVDAPVPGTAAWSSLLANPKVWHVAFHGARDVAEMLVAGRERAYLDQFFDLRAHHPERITRADRDHYTEAYEQPGAMRAAFEAYRALPDDAVRNADLLAAGKLTLPLHVMVGTWSNSGPLLRGMIPEIAADPDVVRCTEFRECGHWVPEEQPEAFVADLREFLHRIGHGAG